MARGKKSKSIELPQLGRAKAGGCGPVAQSKRGKWRALSLFLVHVAMALHIAHWWATGKTITPVEPSEAIETIGTKALVNAGFVLFVLTILTTLVFGRFFCGWACHLVAYQDLCGWLLKKLKIKPQPFRSRLLVFVPLAAAIFLFIAPIVVRLVLRIPRDPYTAHFTTYDFWERFPGWVVGSLTIFVCGFLIIYFLGNKGFCTYACPYGGFFGLADRFAPGKIRVTDDCEQCGHCTAVCSSNVRVHEEVHRFGKVVDPGCMKCLDCVSVCPNDALYFGFSPSVVRESQPPAKPKRHDYSWREEIVLAFFFLFSIVVFRKLYDAVPFLLALALSSMTAYFLLCAARCFYMPQVRFVRFQLRAGGRTTRAGKVFLGAAVVWIGFLVHSATVQVLTIRGRLEMNAARSIPVESNQSLRPLAQARLDRSISLLKKADALGPFPVSNLLFDLAIAQTSRGDKEGAMSNLRRAVDFYPRFAAGRYELATMLKEDGSTERAIEQLREVIRVDPEFPKAHSDLATMLIDEGRAEEAVQMIESLIAARPDVVEFHLALGLALAHAERQDQAMESMQSTVAKWPDHPDGHFNLASMLANRGDYDAAIDSYEEALRLNPNSAPIHFGLASVAEAKDDLTLADRHYIAAKDLDPHNHEYVRAWVGCVYKRGALEKEIARAELAASSSSAARFRLVYLYGAVGRREEARQMAEEFMRSIGHR